MLMLRERDEYIENYKEALSQRNYWSVASKQCKPSNDASYLATVDEKLCKYRSQMNLWAFAYLHAQYL